MRYLSVLKKDKFGMFVFSIFSTIAIIIFLRRSFTVVCNYFISGDMGLWTGDVGQCLIILIGGIPAIVLFYLPKIFEYVLILVDMNHSELITKTVVSLNKPESKAFDKHRSVTNGKNNFYYIWKVKNEKGKKMKTIYFEDVFSFVGKTIGHTYKITYYKHSKVIVDVKKID